MSDLPIHAVLPDLLDGLRTGTGAVLVAPPGAGKTTAVAPALLDEPWCDGTVLLLSPRRVAARAAAERMAAQLGEKAGETIGYATRLDTRQSARTRVLVVTEAIFVNRILADPELPGVSAVLFDEAHERHLDSDLGLALALESRAILREDLRVVVMSATIDGARFAGLLGDDTPVIESEGRAHPLRIEWLGARAEQRIEDRVASAIRQAWRDEAGDILAFLPGVGEIERVRERLAEAMPNTPVLPLHGQVEPRAQQAAIRRDPDGRRRIVLATAIAETSLTLDGVSVVVDSGLSRRAEFDQAVGSNRLVTVRASQAAAAQRAGRAARQGPGVAYRLWEEGGHGGRQAFDPPEIAAVDLAPLVLSLARWGTGDPAALPWLDEPPPASIASARERLGRLGALEDGRLTAFGEKVAALPMDPAQAAMVLYGAKAGDATVAAKLALLLQERGLGGRSEDLLARLQRWDGDRSARAEASRKLAARWAKSAEALVDTVDPTQGDPGIYLARARPDFVARRRDKSGESWQSIGGRGFALDPASPLACADWLAIGDAQGSAKGARITAAIAMEESDVARALSHLATQRRTVRWNAKEGRVEARLEQRIGAVSIASGPDPEPDAQQVEAALLEAARGRLADLLPASLLARARYAAIDALSPEALVENAGQWLAPLLSGKRTLDIPAAQLAEAALSLVGWDTRQRLDTVAPRQWTSPAGTQHAVDYAAEGGPTVEVRVQALFGLDRHPMVGSTPLLLQLTSPAGRPIQATRDLPRFWRGSWADVRKDMKGRYPKHRWPDEPWAEAPSLKTKNAFNR
ncbi:ATP-dependent helicase HrpB [Alteriqipengyuania flavescens]|uniref:ATP-dependent helicase HrpB n=1 Tax=Alteriqipengyuania flavescens TaxID=3053610 RepID=UPI0025B54340|nr:ATP-dependent helicase HrpB [Alteriqipengyuania flavescens]WJY18620.1 ATP-dependent helicase HrpB [Alteriqipengyuania flavescens]WJY24560.1 ATP-dependent helicase HrpB [Alteriqipengyuania flavescens]